MAFVVGRSVEGRPITGERLGTGPTQLLLFGGIHGDEPASVTLCERFLAATVAHELDGAVLVVPALNPDGLLRATKDNARGVDLNRNFAARSWKAEHPPGYFPGSAPLSEPEAAVLAALVDDLSPRVIVAVHQPFRCVNWDGPAESLANQMSAACGYPAVASVGYPTPGSFGAAYGIDRAVSVITFELPRPVADEEWDGCLRALKCATMWRPS